MTRTPGTIAPTDVRPGDYIAYKDTAGIWNTRRVSRDDPPTRSTIILLERPKPDYVAIVIDDGHIDADPETGRPETKINDAFAVRVGNNNSGDATYLINAATPFMLDAADISGMRWHRVSIVDTEQGYALAEEYTCPSMSALLLYAWGENND